jgi:type IV pilus assembly protein PilA
MLNRLNKLREERTEGDKGFTLIELLVVVVILGILIAIAIPLYLNYQKSANDKASQSDVRNAISVLETCNSDNGNYPNANQSWAASAAVSTCTGQTVNTSKNTTLAYYPASTTAASATSYILFGYNSAGNLKGTASDGYWCYASTTGGSVVKKTGAAVPSAYAASC